MTMDEYASSLVGNVAPTMKKKGMAKGAMAKKKKKGMAVGGMKKKKGMAVGGMKRRPKGMARGGFFGTVANPLKMRKKGRAKGGARGGRK